VGRHSLIAARRDGRAAFRARPSGTAYIGVVEILLWLVPPAAVTLLAMLWATWAGRDRRRPDTEDSEAAYERFAAAVQKPHPARGTGVGPRQRDAVSGVAVRRSRPVRDTRNGR
jgi:hypothetical protein